jgi:hypothetical protein
MWQVGAVVSSEYYEDEAIIEQGDEGDSMYILQTGQAQVRDTSVSALCPEKLTCVWRHSPWLRGAHRPHWQQNGASRASSRSTLLVTSSGRERCWAVRALPRGYCI